MVVEPMEAYDISMLHVTNPRSIRTARLGFWPQCCGWLGGLQRMAEVLHRISLMILLTGVDVENPGDSNQTVQNEYFL